MFSRGEKHRRVWGRRDVSGDVFLDADLEGQDLSRVRGLVPGQLSGANLERCKLPPDVIFDQLENLKELSKNAGALMLATMIACGFVLLTAFSTRDIQLLVNAGQANLPVLNISVRIAEFLLISPMILAALYVLLHLYLQRMWAMVATLPAVFPDGLPVYLKTYPWLVNDLVLWGFPRLRERHEPVVTLQLAVFACVTYLNVPVTIALVVWRCFVRHDDGLMAKQCFALGFSVAWAALSFYLAWRTLRRCAAGGSKTLRFWLSFGTLVVAGCFGYLVFEGGMWLGLRTGPPRPGQISGSQLYIQYYWLDGKTGLAEHIRKIQEPVAHPEMPPIVTEEMIAAVQWQRRLASELMTPSHLFGLDIPSLVEDVSLRPSNWEEPEGLFEMRKAGVPPWMEQIESAAREQRMQLAMNKLRAQVPRVSFRRGLELPSLQYLQARGAFLENADFRNVNLKWADLSECDLRGAVWSGNDPPANLDLASLQRADLTRADLSRCSIRGANLGNTKLMGANLADTDLAGAILTGADLRGAKLERTRLFGASFEDANFDGATIVSVNFAYAKMPRSMKRVTMEQCHLDMADLSQVDLSGARLLGHRLSWCKFYQTSFVRTELVDCDFRGADLRQVNFSGAILTRARLSGSRFGNVSFDKAELGGAQLRGFQGNASFDRATFDELTEWPNGKLPTQWVEFNKVRETDPAARGVYRVESLGSAGGVKRFRLVKVRPRK